MMTTCEIPMMPRDLWSRPDLAPRECFLPMPGHGESETELPRHQFEATSRYGPNRGSDLPTVQ